MFSRWTSTFTVKQGFIIGSHSFNIRYTDDIVLMANIESTGTLTEGSEGKQEERTNHQKTMHGC